MENASKALIIAGEILIGLIVVSMLMLMVNSLTSYQQVNTQTKREAQIIEFNNQFEGYNRKKVRGNEVYSLINKVVDYNKRKSSKGVGNDESGEELSFQPMTLTIKFNGKYTKFSLDGTKNELFKSDIIIDGSRIDDSTANDMKRFNDMIPDAINKINILTSGKELPKFNYPGISCSGKVVRYSEKALEKLVDSYDVLFNYNMETPEKAKKDFNTRNDDDAKKINVLDTFNNAMGEAYFEIYQNNGKRLNVNITADKAVNIWYEYLTKGSDKISNGKNIWEDVNVYYEYSQFKKALFDCTSFKYDQNSGRVVDIEFTFTGKFD